ncbi:glycoside hydrolase family 3 domain protein [Catenulispora acidiphila DSM 44928]|uniref:Glycoside hydrolase family 3 domain protein n=1 Tax=Catenulispora acidiphila (strain DSM 44928 / JCM 14897 / NBRC 102108 / NRRL B-24433 / ID139908) TaxID=479433 RepID=C7QIA7_CATAD|nr:glycoside hydrolase family 3 C-terminal domain-containing protein [Catenulispora acidiphila]ACU74984.1 glycoside hydrolase family 3 domain protein [Catenulispora acidiphila DSM 44928]
MDAKALAGLVGRLTLEEKVALLTGEDFWSLRAVPEIGLRKISLSDGPAGVRGTTWDERDPSLLFPNPTALAATWDPGQVRRAGVLMGAQARDKSVAWHLAPNVNLHRSPLGGRHFECYSEDPVLTATVAAAFVDGVQSAGVASTVKHFIGNESETERMTYDAEIDETTLREVYLPPFEAAVRAGAWSVMAAYNSVDGVTMTDNEALIAGVLKDGYGFDGVVVSDWFATRSAAASANAGLDVVMPGPGPQGPWGEALVAAVGKGEVAESVIDDKVLRLLRLADRTGSLDGSDPLPAVSTPDDAAAQLRDIAARAMVVLRNEAFAGEPLLPLNPHSVSRVAVIGPNAKHLTAQGGGSAHVNPAYVISPLTGLTEAFGPTVTVEYAEGVVTQRLLPPLTPETATDPDTGQPGMRVDFIDPAGDVLGSEVRQTSRFVFMGGLPVRTAGIRVRADVVLGEAGNHQFSVSGIGVFRLVIGDNAPMKITLSPTAGADLTEGLVRPPEHRVEIEMDPGTVRLETVVQVDPDLPVAMFGLHHGRPEPGEEELFAAAVAAAHAADVAIVVVGTTDEVESEGSDRTDLRLPGRQDELVAAVAQANPRTIVVVNAGAPVEMPWRALTPAVLWAWFPGQEGGHAVADAVTGAVEPGGRLPTTFPKTAADAPVLSTRPVDGKIVYAEGAMFGYRGYEKAEIVPAYPFGHGLGYTTWEYEDMTAAPTPAGDIELAVRVRNTGGRIGREVVQVYLAGEGDCPQRLIGFGSTFAAPNEIATVPITIPARVLARWDAEQGRWYVRGGVRELIAARSAWDARLRTRVEVAGS